MSTNSLTVIYSARHLAMTRMEEEADQLGVGRSRAICRANSSGRFCAPGHRPAGMVMGSCVCHVGWRGPLRTIAQTGRNVELPNYTQALYEARELAMQRMQTEAQELQADGIVGVSLSERSHGWGSHVIEFFALGTAIVSTDNGSKIEPPVTVLDLNDPR
jgi:uncharacterized protein YbjQ (UPF0145 family)